MKLGTRFNNILLLILLSFFVGGCNKTTKTEASPAAGGAPPQKLTSFAYPHEKGFLQVHGAGYLKSKSECLSCHSSDDPAKNSAAKNAISCTTCHNNFPHPRNWAVPTQHAEAFKQDSQSCAQCHGVDWKGGKSQVGCTECHASFPHPAGWSSPKSHGAAYVAATDKKKDCLTCHDPSLPQNSVTATRCDSCHSAFPHPAGFTGGNALHASLAQSYEGHCTSCHRDFKENMPKRGAKGGCMSCHDGTLKFQWVEDPVPQPEKPKDPPKDAAK